MCGISGFITKNRVNAHSLRAMTNAIRHRGPDDEGYILFQEGEKEPLIFGGPDTPLEDGEKTPSWFPKGGAGDTSDDVMGQIGLGHRRLSILDLSPLGHQPMSYRNGRYWITYNGEIYNYIELRSELESLGHQFLSRTDTEVILASYAQWGLECFARFNGMWSFAIFDAVERKMVLSRDRFGVKPLYYWVSPHDGLFFASEIKQFTSLPGWGALLNQQRAYDFLVWGITDHTDETLFQGVYHVRPGHYAEIDLDKINFPYRDRIETRQWYRIPQAPFAEDFDQAAMDFKRVLRDSVRLRLRSDVPVGSCLSGGLDSTSIVCLMRETLRDGGAENRQKTFSALSRVEKYNEGKWIDAVVDHTQADAFSTYPDVNDLFNMAEEIIWHQDEPFGSTSIFAQWKVFELAADQGVRVMLDGQGADEQLFGYHGAMGIRLSTLFRHGRWVQMFKEFAEIHKLHGYSYKALFSQFAAALLPHSMQGFLRKIMGKTVFKPDWIGLDERDVRMASPFREGEKSVYDYCMAQMTSTNLQMLLHWEDRDSMAHSVESRVPFLDYRVVELSMNLPDDYKTKNGITKRVLRAGMSGVIPDSIRDRIDKIGFATPEETWVRYDAPDLFREKMGIAINQSEGVLNQNCMKFLDDIIAGHRPFSFAVWRMISFGLWMGVFNVKAEKPA